MISNVIEYLAKDILKILQFFSFNRSELLLLKATLANQFQPWHRAEGCTEMLMGFEIQTWNAPPEAMQKKHSTLTS